MVEEMTHFQQYPCQDEKPMAPSLRSWLQLLRTYHRVQRQLQKLVVPHGLTTAQFDVLAHLFCFGDGMTQQTLADTLAVTKGNVVGLLDRLAERGLLERKPDPDDRRVHRLSLTPTGNKLVLETLPAYTNLIAQFLERLTPAELELFSAFLQRIENETPTD